MTIYEAADIIAYQAVSGCTSIFQVIDTLIEEGDIDQKFFLDNESSILGLIDDQIFECESCGWVLPISEVADNEATLICESCYD